MLPDKRKLRKCLESYREPPKAVLSYFRDKNDDKEYAVIGKTLSADGKSVYALLYYSTKRLERATTSSRSTSFLIHPSNGIIGYALCSMKLRPYC